MARPIEDSLDDMNPCDAASRGQDAFSGTLSRMIPPQEMATVPIEFQVRERTPWR